jgi:hypothetical protein
MPMVRIIRNDMTNLRMYGSKRSMSRNAHTVNAGCVGVSKIGLYENPYNVTGIIQRTGSEQAPKGICTDRFIGTWKAMDTNVKGVATR